MPVRAPKSKGISVFSCMVGGRDIKLMMIANSIANIAIKLPL